MKLLEARPDGEVMLQVLASPRERGVWEGACLGLAGVLRFGSAALPIGLAGLCLGLAE